MSGLVKCLAPALPHFFLARFRIPVRGPRATCRPCPQPLGGRTGGSLGDLCVLGVSILLGALVSLLISMPTTIQS